jgi:3'-phosphoadenosine 5'-phosphosulfate sulfotransferase (PAPS reductase)/FAD synthetase
MTAALPARVLGRKQSIRDLATWQAAAAGARDLWPDPLLNRLIDQTVETIRTVARTRHVAYAWSGGKDSLALQQVMAYAGIHECVLGISNLEYPAMLAWVTRHMPDGLSVESTGQDLHWLNAHPMMLFPQHQYGPRWFQIVQHKVQRDYFAANRLDLLALGRRHADGNYTGPAGLDRYTDRHGTVRWSPIAHWSHEAVLALLTRERVELPPCYSWPRGFQVGTGSWPARQWTRSRDHGWCEVWEIDPSRVREAATVLPEAADWMRRSEVE